MHQWASLFAPGRELPQRPARAFARYLPQPKTEYAYWMDGAKDLTAGRAYRRVVALDDVSILNRYRDDSEAPRDESYREDVTLAEATPRESRETYQGGPANPGPSLTRAPDRN